MEPFLDITSVYNHLHHKQSSGRKVSKQSKSLAAICQEVLGVSLSKVRILSQVLLLMLLTYLGICIVTCICFRNFNAVIGHTVLLVKSKRRMQLQMLSVCLIYLMSSKQRLRMKVGRPYRIY